MKNLLRSVLLIITLAACDKNEDLTALEGTYEVIIDPIRCALPTTQQVKITSSGETLKFTYDYFGKSGLTLKDVTAIAQGGETRLFYNGTEIGHYVKDKYLDKSFKQTEGMVLYIHYGNPPNEHIAFMGAK